LTIRDHDFRNPAYPLFGEGEKAPAPEQRYEQYHYRPGAFLIEGKDPDNTPHADDRGVARWDQEFGDERAARALIGERAGRVGIDFETNTVDLWPGMIFSVDHHPHPELPSERRLLVTRFALEGTPEGEWVMAGQAVFADVPYRPAIRRSPWSAASRAPRWWAPRARRSTPTNSAASAFISPGIARAGATRPPRAGYA
jgi:type VI secretion system secreted protein VgrG